MTTVNKKIPLILLGIGILVVGIIALFVFKNKNKEAETEDVVKEIEFSKRPVVSLIPSEDGHWLKMIVDKVAVDKAETLDYEILYSLPDGRPQGAPGSIKLGSEKKVERDFLLGTESSGKYTFDKGVDKGTFTIRYRDSKGKLLAKFSTKFHLQNKVMELTSADGDFVYKMDKESEDWYIVMQTFGLPEGDNAPSSGPYGIFSSSSLLPSGSADGWNNVFVNFFIK